MTGHHEVNGGRLELSRIPPMMFQEAEVPKKWSLVSDGSMHGPEFLWQNEPIAL